MSTLRLVAEFATLAADIEDGDVSAVPKAAAVFHQLGNLLGLQEALQGYLTPEAARRIIDAHKASLDDTLPET
jgi:hypothetical protein